jgi:hypothetical protein
MNLTLLECAACVLGHGARVLHNLCTTVREASGERVVLFNAGGVVECVVSSF